MGLMTLGAIPACLPISHQEIDAVAVSGALLEGSQPLTGREVAIASRRAGESPSEVVCSGAAAVTTGADGMFTSAERKVWRLWAPLIGEGASWRVPVRVCVRSDSGWRLVYTTYQNGGEGEVHIICDLARAPTASSARDESGVCQRTPIGVKVGTRYGDEQARTGDSIRVVQAAGLNPVRRLVWE